jgi:hypothetical protein
MKETIRLKSAGVMRVGELGRAFSADGAKRLQANELSDLELFEVLDTVTQFEREPIDRASVERLKTLAQPPLGLELGLESHIVPQSASGSVLLSIPVVEVAPQYLYGFHRVLTPAGAVVQAADTVDASPTLLHPSECLLYGARFRQKFTLKGAIGSHACSLQANKRLTNDIPLGCLLLLPVGTVNSVQTLKVSRSAHPRQLVLTMNSVTHR